MQPPKDPSTVPGSQPSPLPSKQVLASANYHLDPTLPVGPVFDLKYNGGLFFNTYHNEADTHRMGTHTHTLDSIVYIKLHHTSPIHVAVKVIGLPQPGSYIYTLQHLQTKKSSICLITDS